MVIHLLFNHARSVTLWQLGCEFGHISSRQANFVSCLVNLPFGKNRVQIFSLLFHFPHPSDSQFRYCRHTLAASSLSPFHVSFSTLWVLFSGTAYGLQSFPISQILFHWTRAQHLSLNGDLPSLVPFDSHTNSSQ